MSRDKQIEEITKIIFMYDSVNSTDEDVVRCAKHLYNAGYRKSSDVAREIFEEIQKIFVHRILHNESQYFEGVIDNITKDLDELKKKYTEEGK